jgi:hypothetical protein
MMHQRYLNISTRLLPNSEPTPTEKAKTARRGKATVNALKADLRCSGASEFVASGHMNSLRSFAAVRDHHDRVKHADDGTGSASNEPRP